MTTDDTTITATANGGADAKASPSYTLPKIGIFERASKTATSNPSKVAIVDTAKNASFTYRQLLKDTAKTKALFLQLLGSPVSGDLKEQRIAYLVPSGYDYVAIQWAIWAAGGIAVPICVSHPLKEMHYTISDSQPSLIVVHPSYSAQLENFKGQFPDVKVHEFTPLVADEDGDVVNAWSFTDELEGNRGALMIYTSGTTSKPKGCVSTHLNIDSQFKQLNAAWAYEGSDRLVHVLPLHHVHGIVPALNSTLSAGGTVEMHAKFDPAAVWKRWASGETTLFMAVPTVYSRLIAYYESNIRGTPDEDKYVDGARNLRLLVSGSAALPTSIKHRFREITGQTLLERYGMTEIGMGLSCRYNPTTDGVNGRPDGSVGWPLDPSITVRLVKEDGTVGEEGEIQIKGPNVFREYWNKPEATLKEFDGEFFKTGDIAHRDPVTGAYYIHGRASVDIIKSGGYKISALDVERAILSCVPGAVETAVVGLEDEEWGQRVAAVVRFEKEGQDIKTFRNSLREELAAYKIPSVLKIVSSIDRNAMGKVNKKDLIQKLWPQQVACT